MLFYSTLQVFLLCLAIFPYVSNGECSSIFGVNINVGDCNELLHGISTFVSGLRFKDPIFIRQPGGDLQNLPRSFTMVGGTCSMAVDLPGGMFQRRRGDWSTHLRQLQILMLTCVEQRKGLGGLINHDGFEYTLVHPAGGSDPNVEIPACLRPATLPTPSVGQCMLRQQSNALAGQSTSAPQAVSINTVAGHNIGQGQIVDPGLYQVAGHKATLGPKGTPTPGQIRGAVRDTSLRQDTLPTKNPNPGPGLGAGQSLRGGRPLFGNAQPQAYPNTQFGNPQPQAQPNIAFAYPQPQALLNMLATFRAQSIPEFSLGIDAVARPDVPRVAQPEPLRQVGSATTLTPERAVQLVKGKLLLNSALTFGSRLIEIILEPLTSELTAFPAQSSIFQPSTSDSTALPAQSSTFQPESRSRGRPRMSGECKIPSYLRIEIWAGDIWQPWDRDASWETSSGILRIIKKGVNTPFPTHDAAYSRAESSMRHWQKKTLLQGAWVSDGLFWLSKDELIAQLKAKAAPQRTPFSTIDLSLQLFPEFRAGPAETEWLEKGHWIMLLGESSAEAARPRKRTRTGAGPSVTDAEGEDVQAVEAMLADEDANTPREREQAANALLTMGNLVDKPSPLSSSQDQEDSEYLP